MKRIVPQLIVSSSLLIAAAGFAAQQPAAAPAAEPNQLTAEQKKAGWKLLFDGKSLDGWRGYKQKTLPASWEVRDGAIFCNDKPGPDLLTVEKYGDFELS